MSDEDHRKPTLGDRFGRRHPGGGLSATGSNVIVPDAAHQAPPLTQQMSGSLKEKPISYLLQMADHYEVTGELVIADPQYAVTIQFGLGQPIHAFSPYKTGTEAILELFIWKDGNISFTEDVQPQKPSVEENTPQIITLGDEYVRNIDFLRQLEITDQAFLLRSPIKLTDAEFEKTLLGGAPLNRKVQKEFYGNIYGTLNIKDISEKMNLTESKWMATVANLLRLELILTPTGKRLDETNYVEPPPKPKAPPPEFKPLVVPDSSYDEHRTDPFPVVQPSPSGTWPTIPQAGAPSAPGAWPASTNPGGPLMPPSAVFQTGSPPQQPGFGAPPKPVPPAFAPTAAKEEPPANSWLNATAPAPAPGHAPAPPVQHSVSPSHAPMAPHSSADASEANTWLSHSSPSVNATTTASQPQAPSANWLNSGASSPAPTAPTASLDTTSPPNSRLNPGLLQSAQSQPSASPNASNQSQGGLGSSQFPLPPVVFPQQTQGAEKSSAQAPHSMPPPPPIPALAEVQKSLQIGVPQEVVTFNSALTERVLASMIRTDSGIFKHDALMFFLEREFARAFRFSNSFTLMSMCITSANGSVMSSDPIQSLVTALDNMKRDIDMFGHFGERGFGLILPNIDSAQACGFADRVLQTLPQQVPQLAQFAPMLHFGIAAVPTDAKDITSLIAASQQAMMEAARRNVTRVRYSELTNH